MGWVHLKALHFVGREVREISAIETKPLAQMMGKRTTYASEQGFLASNFLCLYMTGNRKALEFWSCATSHNQDLAGEKKKIFSPRNSMEYFTKNPIRVHSVKYSHRLLLDKQKL